MSATKPILYGDTIRWGLIEGDTLAVLPQLPDASVDAVVTDPPYAISLGGRAWDRFGDRDVSPAEAFERWTCAWRLSADECSSPAVTCSLSAHRGPSTDSSPVSRTLAWKFATNSCG